MAMLFAFPALFVRKLLKINKLLVEAAGVEPASEIAVSRESPCCVRFDWFRSAELKNGQDAPEASPMILDCNTDRAAPTSLLNDVRSQPIGETVKDGSLVN